MQAQRKVYLLFLPSLPPPHVLTFSFSNHARNKHPNTSKGLGYRIQHALELGLQINQDQQQKKKNSSRENISIQQGHNNRMHKVSNATLLTGTSQKAGTRRTQPPASTVWYFKKQFNLFCYPNAFLAFSLQIQPAGTQPAQPLSIAYGRAAERATG